MRIVTRVRIGNDRIYMGKGVKELLDAIEECNSIKEATRRTGISYPKAMRMIKTLNEELGFEVVTSSKGGATRGGSALSEKGKQMLEDYRKVEQQVQDYAAKIIADNFKY